MISVRGVVSDEPDSGDPTFEEVVSALLKVDPEGIVGQKAGRAKKQPENDEDPAPE